MANNLSGRPWILDTASTTVPVKFGKTFTTGFVFRDYGTNGDAAVIKDGRRGIIIAKLVGNASLAPVGEAWFTPQIIDDMLLIQLDGNGIVEVIVQ